MMTRSLGARPLRITRRPSCSAPVSTSFGHDRAVGGDGHHHLARLVGHDGGRRHQQRRGRSLVASRSRANWPGRDGEVRIGDGGAGVDRAAAAVERVVDEIERAVTVEMPIAIQADGDVVGSRRAMMGPPVSEVVRLAHVEIEIDRIERDDRGEQRRRAAAAPAAADQVADRDEVRADASGERRDDAGEFEVELRVLDCGLGGVDGGLRAALFGGALIDGLRRTELRQLELPGAPQLGLGQRRTGLRRLELRDRLVEA